MKHHHTKKSIHHIGLKCVEAWFFVVALLIMFFIGQGVARIEFEPVVPGAGVGSVQRSTTLVSNIESAFTDGLVAAVTVEVLQSTIAAYPINETAPDTNVVNAEFNIVVHNPGTVEAVFKHQAFTLFKVLDDEGNVVVPSNPQSVISCTDVAYDQGYIVPAGKDVFCTLTYTFNNDAISTGFYKVEIATKDSTGFVAVSGRSSAADQFLAYASAPEESPIVEAYYQSPVVIDTSFDESTDYETLWSPYGLTANILPGTKSIIDSVALLFGR